MHIKFVLCINERGDEREEKHVISLHATDAWAPMQDIS